MDWLEINWFIMWLVLLVGYFTHLIKIDCELNEKDREIKRLKDIIVSKRIKNENNAKG